MAKRLLIIMILIFCFSRIVRGQSDTSNYDLSRILLKKQFTQSITVKGNDLEQYPFSNLADAINVWFYGTYTNASTLVYVIDGNIINDVNAYSIYDIDEITLVQNALGQVSGASPGQQLVLIKLKTDRPGKQGIKAAGQTNVVSAANTNNAPTEKSSARIYNQYYLSGYKNFEDFSLGVSADYQRDAVPQPTSGYYNPSPPFNFNRLKLNVWGSAKLADWNTITIGLNYTPQTSNIAYGYTLLNSTDASYNQPEHSNGHISQHLFNATIAIKSDIIAGLTNNFSAAYNQYNYFERNNLAYSIPNYYLTPNGYESLAGDSSSASSVKTENLLIRDNLIYKKKIGDFLLEPSINFSFRNFRGSSNYSTGIASGTGTNFELSNVSSLSSSSDHYSTQYETYLLSPSLNATYKGFLNLQGGVVSILNPSKDFVSGYGIPRFSPFLTASADVSKIPGFSVIRLKIFGSFSKQNAILDDQYSSLAGLSSVSNPAASTAIGLNSTGTSVYTDLPVNPYQQYNNYQAGFNLSLPRNLSINYSFEYRFYQTLEQIIVPFGANEDQIDFTYVNDKIITNRFGVNYYVGSNNFSWKTGLNMAESKLQVIGNVPIDIYANNYLNTGNRLSGGFTNRFDYNTFFLGIDVLYQIGSRPYTLLGVYPSTTSYIAPASSNSFSLQNFYAGIQINVRYLKYAEVFLNGRNLLQSNTSYIIDNQRFFGFGFRAGL
jgi:hypothetical protein